MVTLTPRAADEVKRILREQHRPESTTLRVGVLGGGCSGYEYRLQFVDQADEQQDLVAESHGVKIAVDKKSSTYLAGTEIDIHEGLDKRGFVFNNPLAIRTCGCGSSFGV